MKYHQCSIHGYIRKLMTFAGIIMNNVIHSCLVVDTAHLVANKLPGFENLSCIKYFNLMHVPSYMP